jgi:hypothetical protein
VANVQEVNTLFTLNWMLADAAQAVNGKLYVLGAGWSNIVAGAPFCIFGKIDIPWHLGTDWHQLRVELLEGDGQPFLAKQDPDGEPEPVVIEPPKYRPTIAPHVKPGTPLDWPFSIMVGLPLEPGTLYEWKMSINGESQDGWTLPFTTRPAALANAA